MQHDTNNSNVQLQESKDLHKIISIDVGIKNLAFCLLSTSVNEENEPCFFIEKWDSIDLTKSQLQNQIDTKCSCVTSDKKNKKPPKSCTVIAEFTKNGKYYCKKHAKQSDFFIPSKELMPPYINKQKLDVVIQLVKKYDIYDISLDACKKPQLVSLLNEHIKKNSMDIIEKTNASEFNLVSIGKNIQSNFDMIFKDDISTIQLVAIENQISPIANRMKTIQGMIAQYFIMKNNSIHIEFISSANKLKSLDKGEKATYSDRKKMSIVKCIEYMDQHSWLQKWKTFFTQHKKKDDLADSFLQGVYVIQR